MRRLAAATGLALLAGCSNLANRPPAGSRAACHGYGLQVDADFERGALAACSVSDPGTITMEIAPESVPINDSAWYAFRVRASRAQTVTVQLRVRDGTFRYAPQTRTDGGAWQTLDPLRVAHHDDGRGATLRVDVDTTPLVIAAQPLETVAEALAAVRPALRQQGFDERVLGRSRDGRPIVGFEWRPPRATGLIVLLARQHPPEVTGNDAFTAFVQRVAGDDATAEVFRRHAALLIVPVVNPDGLARGHWRGNARAADTNRDWTALAEPETRAVATRIAELAAETPLLALIDFHSTRRDVIYAAPEGAATAGLADTFLAELQRKLGDRAPPVVRNHTPGNSTAKAWALDRHGVGGLTYEVGDATRRAVATRTATAAADVLMGSMLRQYVAPRSPSFVFDDWAGPSIPVWSYRPQHVGADAPMVFVMHGVGRDADRYLAEWLPLAERHDFIVVVPEYSRDAFPGAAAYNLGGVADAAGGFLPRSAWSFSAIEPIFDAIRDRERLGTTGYRLYGHSAGAQFVHRFVLLGAGPRLQRAIAANAGWYSFPDDTADWPYGLRAAPPGTDPAAGLAAPLTVLLGDADTNPAHPSLRHTPEADRQGPHRLERGRRFYAAGRETARLRVLPFGWSCAIAPGVGHDNARVVEYAVPLLLDTTVLPSGNDCAVAAPISARTTSGESDTPR
jgi:poly(3-hydroxybutyrate) depolymerase